MDAWGSASLLLLISLFSWNVHCFPSEEGWGQDNPHGGSFSNVETRPGSHLSLSQGLPAQPANMNDPAVSYLYDPMMGGGYFSSYPVSNRPATDHPRRAPVWDPEEESDFRMSPPVLDVIHPPAPQFQAGELDHYEENFEAGNFEREREDLDVLPPPLPAYPGSEYQAGELSHSKAIYENGEDEWETDEQGFAPPRPYELPSTSAASSSERFGPSHLYLLLTGRIPPGTFSYFQTEYDTGRDHWNDVHYERNQFPIAQGPTSGLQIREDPSGDLWQEY